MDRSTAQKIAVFYALGAGVWIIGSDTVLTVIWDDALSHWLYGTVKGIAFVVLTTTLLYWLLVSLGAKEQAKYRTLFHTNPHPMWVFDKTTRYFLTANDAAIEHLGYARAELLRMTVDAVVSRDQAPRSIVEPATAIGTSYDAGLAVVRKKDGTTLVVKTASHKVPFDGISACSSWHGT
jgi:PAS domain S-box-containing protein